MLSASTSNGSAVNADKEQSLRDQESALIKLAELYRDQKWGLQSLLLYASPHVKQRCQWLSASHHTLEIIHVFNCQGKDRQAEWVASVFDLL
jgi:hypothetical protein